MCGKRWDEEQFLGQVEWEGGGGLVVEKPENSMATSYLKWKTFHIEAFLYSIK